VHKSPAHSSRGFTLIELMVVFVVIGIVAVIGVPAFGSYRVSYMKRQAREQITQDIRGARQSAVTRHAQVVMAFGNGVTTTNLTSYTIHVDTNGDGVYQSTERKLQRTMPKDTRLAQVSLSPTDTIKFDISGILKPGTNGGAIVIGNTRNQYDTLSVTPAGMVYRP
jgi:prepilin-type N-terminal cleavage/methylation domain-containing protein